MDPILYKIPVSLAKSYRGKAIIARSTDPEELVSTLPDEGSDELLGAQLLDLNADVEPLAGWHYSLPVELVMSDPLTQYPLLYRHAKLLDKHPVRVSIPVVEGLGKAVKVASSLLFDVRLEPGQPAPEVADELFSVLDFYLHHSAVSQPIEYFHSTLASFFHEVPVTLWDVQGEDPAFVRYVEEDGDVSISRRSVHTGIGGDLENFTADLRTHLLAGNTECSSCSFFENCGGYFKWPDEDYDCLNVKVVFETLKTAAEDLRQDLRASAVTTMEVRL